MAMLTVQTYADSRKLSVATVKNHIKKLELDLPLNPQDNRQRLISLDNQRKLDESTRRSAPTAAVPTIEAELVEVTPYVRSQETAMIIAEGQILEAQLTTYQPAHENPYLTALKSQIAQQSEANALRYQQVVAGITSTSDTTIAINAARRMRLVEEAQREAAEEFMMKQQMKQQTTDELNLLSLGITPPKPQPSPSQSVSVATSPELQPDWL